MIKRNMWTKIKKKNIPKERRLIGSKWVMKVKKNGIYRARLVALGYSQIPGVDFSENFAPVINDVTLRIILVMWIVKKWHAEIIDVETAFLYGDLEEEIYLKIPDGLQEIKGNADKNEDCLLLNHALYGLVQAARSWWLKLTTTLLTLGFCRCKIDPCLLIRTTDDKTVIFCIYVDDVCCVGDKEEVKEAIEEVKKIYDIKYVGELREYVGVTIEKNDNGSVDLSQPDSIKLLELKFKEDVKKMKIFKSPAASSDVVMRPKSEEEKMKEDLQQKYRSGVGMLLWLTKHSRPDIPNAVREASKVMDGATLAHFKYMLRIVKYVIDTRE